MTHRIEDLTDTRKIKGMMEEFHALTGISSVLVRPDGKWILDEKGDLLGGGHPRIWFDFHARPPSGVAVSCEEGDAPTGFGLDEMGGAGTFRCWHGLYDAALRIDVDREHLADLVTGPFFMAPPDESQFRAEARRCGFDEDDYLAALHEVPVYSQDRIRAGIRFLSHLASFISELGSNRLSLKAAQGYTGQGAMTDSLTGLFSRAYFEHALDQEWRLAIRNQQPLSLLMIELDFFRNINDTEGPERGDEALRQVADAVRSVIRRPTDLAVRFTGEVLVCMLPDTDDLGARRVAGQVRKAVEALAFPVRQAPLGPLLTVSTGVATLYPYGNQSPSLIVSKASENLDKARQQGGNRVVS
jgi:diguanylate cyclase (GGDEF)-like protein